LPSIISFPFADSIRLRFRLFVAPVGPLPAGGTDGHQRLRVECADHHDVAWTIAERSFAAYSIDNWVNQPSVHVGFDHIVSVLFRLDRGV
jgi:hypothetical protein